MTTNVELYEALKPTVGAEAARMIAEVVPPTRDLATKDDVAATRADIADTRAEIGETRTQIAQTNARIDALEGRMREEFANVRGEMREGFAQLRVELHKSHTSTLRWFLGFSVPLWLGTWGTMTAVLLKG